MIIVVAGTLNDNTLAIFSRVPWAMSGGSGSLPDLSSAWAVVSTVNSQVIAPFAMSMVGLCFTIRMAQTVTDYERMFMTPERFMTPFMQMIACMFIAAHAFQITMYLMQIGCSIAVQVQNHCISLLSSDVGSLTAEMMPELESGGFFAGIKELFNALSVVASLTLPWLAYKIVSLLTKVAAYGVIIELLARASLFPLFAGDIMLHGADGSGFRIFKGFLASCCQGAVVVLIAGITNGLNYSALRTVVSGNANLKTFVANIFLSVIYSAAGFALMLKSGELVKDAFGAR